MIGRRPSRSGTGAAAIIVSIFAFWLYHATLLPGVDLGDTPSFQTMGGSSVVSPRDAYPLYFALSAPLVWWSGDPARALNLASAAEAALTCGVLVLVGVELTGVVGAAVGMALIFAGSYTFWSQAVIAEVYALHMLCIALVLYAALRWQRRPSTSRMVLLLASYALGFGNHLTMVLLLPGLALFLALAAPDGARTLLAPRTIAIAIACAALGALQYAWNLRTLFADPTAPRDIAEAIRWFWFDVTKSDWRDAMVLTLRGGVAGERARMFLFDVQQQFGWLFVAIAGVGFGALIRTDRAQLALFTVWLACTSAFALTYNVGDPHVFLLPTHLVLAVLTAPGIAWLAHAVAFAVGPSARPVVPVAVLVLALTRIAGEYPALDRSLDRRPAAALAALTAGIDDRRSVLLADLNWQLQNALNYYARHTRTDLTFGGMPGVLPYAPALIRDNHAIGREVLLTERAQAQLAAAYGPLLPTVRDPSVAVATLAERVASLPDGTRYVMAILKPTPDNTWDPADAERALAHLTGGRLTAAPADDYVAVAGLVGAPPRLLAHSPRPFRTGTTLDGLSVQVRMESWLAFDTIRRMGFGHVIAARRHALIIERGVSLVALAADGQPIRTEYAAGLYGPQPRFVVLRRP
jgi:hypothetical protein